MASKQLLPLNKGVLKDVPDHAGGFMLPASGPSTQNTSKAVHKPSMFDGPYGGKKPQG